MVKLITSDYTNSRDIVSDVISQVGEIDLLPIDAQIESDIAYIQVLGQKWQECVEKDTDEVFPFDRLIKRHQAYRGISFSPQAIIMPDILNFYNLDYYIGDIEIEGVKFEAIDAENDGGFSSRIAIINLPDQNDGYIRQQAVFLIDNKILNQTLSLDRGKELVELYGLRPDIHDYFHMAILPFWGCEPPSSLKEWNNKMENSDKVQLGRNFPNYELLALMTHNYIYSTNPDMLQEKIDSAFNAFDIIDSIAPDQNFSQFWVNKFARPLLSILPEDKYLEIKSQILERCTFLEESLRKLPIRFDELYTRRTLPFGEQDVHISEISQLFYKGLASVDMSSKKIIERNNKKFSPSIAKDDAKRIFDQYKEYFRGDGVKSDTNSLLGLMSYIIQNPQIHLMEKGKIIRNNELSKWVVSDIGRPEVAPKGLLSGFYENVKGVRAFLSYLNVVKYGYVPGETAQESLENLESNIKGLKELVDIMTSGRVSYYSRGHYHNLLKEFDLGKGFKGEDIKEKLDNFLSDVNESMAKFKSTKHINQRY